MPVTSGFGHSGQLDFYCCHNGRFFVVETKADTDVTLLQALEMELVVKAGAPSFVIRQDKGMTYGIGRLMAFLEGQPLDFLLDKEAEAVLAEQRAKQFAGGFR